MPISFSRAVGPGPATSSVSPAFATSGKAERVAVGGLSAEKRGVSPQVKRALTGASAVGVTAHAASFSFDRAALQAALKSPAAFDALAYGALFYSLPKANIANDWDPSYRTLKTAEGKVTAKELKPRTTAGAVKALSAALHVDLSKPTSGYAELREFVKKSPALVAALLQGQETALYVATWSNQDDTELVGLMAVDSKTGQVRTLMVHQG